MKYKNFVIQILVLLLLIIAAIGGYSFGKSAPQVQNSYPNYIPPLIELDAPPQTVNGMTAKLESYYADGLRFVFVIKVTGENNAYIWDNVSLADARNQFVNASYSLSPMENDLSLFYVDMALETPHSAEAFTGKLSIDISPMSSEFESANSSHFEFEIQIPVKPVTILSPNQVASANGVNMLLEKAILSPAFTRLYICYNKPSSADWMIGGGARLTINGQQGSLQTYSLLYDSELGDMGKSSEPNWSPPIETGRCVKLGFALGSENPANIQLTIPTLDQSIPEAIPEDELQAARKTLLSQGIDIDWQITAFPEGGGMSGPVYNQLPAGMTEEEAFQKLIQTLGYIHQGPWEFTLQP